jgi:hypothetical protein
MISRARAHKRWTVDNETRNLVITKLDRLSRNLAFIATLMDSGVEFIAVDNPHATKLTVHILAAVAQHEREMVAQRTKDALQAAKARGVVLGNPKLDAVRDRAVASVKADADRFAKNVAPIIREIQSTGVTSHRGIARSLKWTAFSRGAFLSNANACSASKAHSSRTKAGKARSRNHSRRRAHYHTSHRHTSLHPNCTISAAGSSSRKAFGER